MRVVWTQAAFLIVLSTSPLSAQDSTQTGPPDDPDDSGWVSAWMKIAASARASQPHFVAPIVTTHVMLVQQFRYDLSWQQDPGGQIASNYGNSRGLEIIPASRLEVGIFLPPYITHQTQAHQTQVPNGFGDFSYQVKFRAFSGTEGKGDYFIGFFFGGSAPTGSAPNGSGHAVVSPNVAAAKGLGPWDIQTTFGANLPVSGTNVSGRTLVFNTAVDYRIKARFWPMLEQNSTFWVDGPLTGQKQVFLTPGIIAGPFPVKGVLHFGVGVGVQTAVTEFHQFNHRWILSIRFPF